MDPSLAPTQEVPVTSPRERPREPDFPAGYTGPLAFRETAKDLFPYRLLCVLAALLAVLAAVASVVALNNTTVPVRGPQGPAGIDGRNGLDGEQGPQGIPGPPGLDGANAPEPTTTTTIVAQGGNFCIVRGQAVPCDSHG